MVLSDREKRLDMKRANEKPIELSDEELHDVTGGGLLHFIRAIAIPGTAEAGGSGSTDPNVATHTQLWVTSAS
jgi:hypothetical protein